MNRWRARLIWASVLSTLSVSALLGFGKAVPAYAAHLKAQNIQPSALVKLGLLISNFVWHNVIWLVPVTVIFWFGVVCVSAVLLQIREQALTPIGDPATDNLAKED